MYYYITGKIYLTKNRDPEIDENLNILRNQVSGDALEAVDKISSKIEEIHSTLSDRELMEAISLLKRNINRHASVGSEIVVIDILPTAEAGGFQIYSKDLSLLQVLGSAVSTRTPR